jgi:hypothetical protein
LDLLGGPLLIGIRYLLNYTLPRPLLCPFPEAYYPTLKTTLILSQNIPPAVFLTIFVFFLPRKLGIFIFSVVNSTKFAEFLERIHQIFNIAKLMRGGKKTIPLFLL